MGQLAQVLGKQALPKWRLSTPSRCSVIRTVRVLLLRQAGYDAYDIVISRRGRPARPLKWPMVSGSVWGMRFHSF